MKLNKKSDGSSGVIPLIAVLGIMTIIVLGGVYFGAYDGNGSDTTEKTVNQMTLEERLQIRALVNLNFIGEENLEENDMIIFVAEPDEGDKYEEICAVAYSDGGGYSTLASDDYYVYSEYCDCEEYFSVTDIKNVYTVTVDYNTKRISIACDENE